MPNCHKIKEKLEDIHRSKDELVDLLDQYQQTGSPEDKQGLIDALDNFSFKDFRQFFQEQVENLLAEHPYSQEFAGKLSFENGEVMITDDLYFRHQTDIYLPSIIDKIEGCLNLHSLESAEHLELPDKIEGYLNLPSLKSTKHLEVPDKIKGGLYLDSIKSAKYLQLPDKVEGTLNLNSLQSAEHLELHDNIKGDIYLDSLYQRERKQLRDEYPNLADQITTT